MAVAPGDGADLTFVTAPEAIPSSVIDGIVANSETDSRDPSAVIADIGAELQKRSGQVVRLSFL